MMEIIGFGRIRQGEPLIDHRAWFLAQIPPDWEGKRIRLTARLEGDETSGGLRGYYRGIVCGAFAAYLRNEGVGGATPDMAHEILAQMFLSLGPCPVTGMPRTRSTRAGSMSAEEFRGYLDEQVLPYLTQECHLEIPEPDPAKRSPRRIRELQRRDERASRGAVSR
ncbi:MAG: hypothetical protein IT577_16090 [Verrucomicrobiae bacterium]|nr:hypothetical protein [Verrucomicrobiae bacterium]